MNSTIDNVFNNAVEFNILEDDYLGTGTLEVSSNEQDYEFLNGLKLDYAIGSSISNDYVNFTGNLTQGADASLKASAYVDKNNMYVNLEEIFPLLINYDLEENYFETVKEELKKSSDLTTDDIYRAVSKAVTYFGESLKEIDSQNNLDLKGLNIEYVFNINKDNYQKFSNKYKELIKNDEQFKTLNDKFNFIEDEQVDDVYNYVSIDDTTINVKVNALTREVTSFKITSGDETIIGQRTDKNMYKITSDKTVINAEVTNNKLVLDISEDGENIAKFSGIIDNNKMSYNLKNYDGNMEIDVDITKVGNSEMKVTTNVNYEGIKVKNAITNKFGKSLVKREQIGNFRKYDDLSDNSINYIQKGLMEKLGKFKAYQGLTNASYSDGYYY